MRNGVLNVQCLIAQRNNFLHEKHTINSSDYIDI